MNYDNGNYGKDFNLLYTIPRRKDIAQDQSPSKVSSVLSSTYENIPNAYPKVENKVYERRMHMLTGDPSKSIDTDYSVPTKKKKSSVANLELQTSVNKDIPGPSRINTQSRFRDMHDATLPQELLSLYQPLFCKVCMMQLTSNSMAKLHYNSKNHDKKVRVWLKEYSERTGEPLHEKVNARRVKREEDNVPKYFHCDVCDLNLTGKMHAESHYMGKNHQRALMGKKDPAGRGAYNNEGKWTRTGPSKKEKTVGDGFGQDFANKDRMDVIMKKWSETSPPVPAFRCDICDITVISQGQLEAHLNGIKHKKKEKSADLAVTLSQRLAGNDDCILEPEAADDEPNALYDPMDTYRIPGGHFFYCKVCDVSLNSNYQIMDHLKSKKHRNKHAEQALESMKTDFDVAQPESSDDIFSHL